MSTAAERRRMKLLARGAQLDAAGGPSNPQTQANAKPAPAPAPSVQSTTSQSTAAQNSAPPAPSTPIEDLPKQSASPQPTKAAPAKPQKMDLNKMMRLMDMKKTFGVSKSLIRVFFALLCGFTFHAAFFLYNVHHANVSTFAVCLVLLYSVLDWVEDSQFTKPIEVRNTIILFFFYISFSVASLLSTIWLQASRYR